MASSATPAAMDQLLILLRDSPDLAGVLIVDGPPRVNFTDTERVYVGFSPGSDQAADISQQFASAGARTRDENFSIACYAEVVTGDTDMQPARQRVFALVAAVETALRATDLAPTAPTLNGTVQWAGLTAAGLVQQQEPDGTLAGVTFSVTCRARI